MNYKLLGKILGKIMILEGILMVAPLIVSFVYKEFQKSTVVSHGIGGVGAEYGGIKYVLAFLIPIVILVVVGFLLQIPKPKRTSLYQKEGFALVALVWIVMALFGAIPFVINGDIPNYIDACFEITSGFTTTGASVIDDITAISHSSLFWRSFSHWIGGMGILVFVLIFIPESKDGSAMHLLRAESPGPQVGKIVSKMRATARILYLIYLGMTTILAAILMLAPLVDTEAAFAATGIDYSGDKIFHALLTAFGCAGTGGFGFIPGSMQYFSPAAQYIVSVALLLFGVNFTLYYLILIGKIKDVFRSEEIRTYVSIISCAVAIIFAFLLLKNPITSGSVAIDYSTEEAFRHSLFQVSSIITTAGFTTTDFNIWPMAAKMVLVVCMFIGAMAGSTAGGIKTSRIVMAVKGSYIKIRKLINPRYVPKAKFEGKALEEKTINDVFAFFTMYFIIFIVFIFILCLDPVNGSTTTVTSDVVNSLPTAEVGASSYQVEHGFFTNFSAVLSCMSNIGPGFEAVGPYASFSGYNGFSTIVLTLTMIIGRLEILPVLILFSPRTWKKH